MKSPLSLIAILASLGAAAETPVATVENNAVPERRGRESHQFAILLDGGVPDGVGVSLAFRPLRWTRLELGVTENLASPGIRGGVTLLPFNYWITPTLTLEAGHYFSGNANSVAQRFSASSPAWLRPLLQDFSYDYGNAHLGLEIGSSRFAFYLRGGLSYVTSTVRNVQPALQQGSTGDATFTSAKDGTIRGVGPSAKLGFVVYFL